MFIGRADAEAEAPILWPSDALGLIPELGQSPEEGNGYPLQYSYLENYMDGGAWQATVYGTTKNQT